MTQHRDIDINSPERGVAPASLSASFVDLLRSREGTKGGDRLMTQAGDYISFNENQAVSAKHGGTAFLTHPLQTAIDKVAFLTNPPQTGIDKTAFLTRKTFV